jgi:hypothetical protein
MVLLDPAIYPPPGAASCIFLTKSGFEIILAMRRPAKANYRCQSILNPNMVIKMSARAITVVLMGPNPSIKPRHPSPCRRQRRMTEFENATAFLGSFVARKTVPFQAASEIFFCSA